MKKFSDWFTRQTVGARIALIVTAVAIVIAGLASLSQFLKQDAEVVVPDDTSTSAPVEEEPTPTAEPTEAVVEEPNLMLDAPVDDEGGYSIIPNDKSTFTNDDLNTLPGFVQNAAVNLCQATDTETSDARLARLSQWFDAGSDAMKPNGVVPVIKAQQCSNLGVIVGQPDPETGNLPVNATVLMYTVLLNTSVEGETAANATHENYRFVTTFRDGKWVILENSQG